MRGVLLIILIGEIKNNGTGSMMMMMTITMIEVVVAVEVERVEEEEQVGQASRKAVRIWKMTPIVQIKS